MKLGMLDEKIPGHPYDVREGDNRHTRSMSGSRNTYFGWYSETQVMARRMWAKGIEDYMRTGQSFVTIPFKVE